MDYYQKVRPCEICCDVAQFQECCQICKPPRCDSNNNICVNLEKEDMKRNCREKGRKVSEVCNKICDETDYDVFLVRLVSKQNDSYKQRVVDMELKQPKRPIVLKKTHSSRGIQASGAQINFDMGICRKKKKKPKTCGPGFKKECRPKYYPEIGRREEFATKFLPQIYYPKVYAMCTMCGRLEATR